MTLFEQEHDYYKPTRIGNFWNNNYIIYESSGDRNKNLSLKEYLDRNKNLSLKEYLDKVKPNLKDIIIDLQESDTWKIQLTITINFISSKDTEEEQVIY